MSRRQVVLIWLFGIAYALLTAVTDHSYYQLILTVVPVWAVIGLAWNVLSGYSGFVSFGHAAFFGLGAYFVALAQLHWGLSPWIGIPCAGIVSGVAGLVVGIATFRLRGHYFHRETSADHRHCDGQHCGVANATFGDYVWRHLNFQGGT